MRVANAFILFIKNVVAFYVRWVVMVGDKLFFIVYPLETVFVGCKPFGQLVFQMDSVLKIILNKFKIDLFPDIAIYCLDEIENGNLKNNVVYHAKGNVSDTIISSPIWDSRFCRRCIINQLNQIRDNVQSFGHNFPIQTVSEVSEIRHVVYLNDFFNQLTGGNEKWENL